MNMHEAERMSAEQVINGFVALEKMYECRILFMHGREVVKLAGGRGGATWEVASLAGRSRAEVKGIVADAIKRIGIKRRIDGEKDREVGSAYMAKMQAVVADAPVEEISAADEKIKEVKARRNGPRQTYMRFKFSA